MTFAGTPYLYGGKNPLTGLDCSGLVVELLMAAGAVPFGFEANAQGIYSLLSGNDHCLDGQLGALAFFGPSVKAIDHVGFCLDEARMIEAGGGHADCITIEIAKKESAFVKVRPIRYRRDFLCVIMPNYP